MSAATQLECLAETIWQSQRSGTPLDEKVCLECLEQQSSVKP